jgi:oxygen-dependent protoporphyrinogen oxidase
MSVGAAVNERHVVVVGAGLAGLAAARTLMREGVRVTVLEQSSAPGGRVRAAQLTDGGRIDVGAQFVALFSSETLRLVDECGASQLLERVRQASAVIRDGVAWPLAHPQDLLLEQLLSGSARRRLPGLTVPVLAAWPRLDPARLVSARCFDRRSALDLVRAWADDEVATYVLNPLVRGLLYWDLDTTSQGVLLAMLKTAAAGSTVLRPTEGMETVIRALASGIRVRTGATVASIGLDASVETEDGLALEADAVICTTPAPVAARLVRGLPAASASLLEGVTYSSTTGFVFRVARGRELPTSSRLFPEPESPWLASVNPPEGSLRERGDRHVRVFLSNRGHREFAQLGNADAASRARDAVRACEPDADWTEGAEHVGGVRWDLALPRFPAGSLRSPMLNDPGVLDAERVVFAGDYLCAPHLEGAVRSGIAAAERALAL